MEDEEIKGDHEPSVKDKSYKIQEEEVISNFKNKQKEKSSKEMYLQYAEKKEPERSTEEEKLYNYGSKWRMKNFHILRREVENGNNDLQDFINDMEDHEEIMEEDEALIQRGTRKKNVQQNILKNNDKVEVFNDMKISYLNSLKRNIKIIDEEGEIKNEELNFVVKEEKYGKRRQKRHGII